MSKDNNIKNFTAADIEKYHKGLLSAKERHELEKAALDDPFLADAMEGYAFTGVNYSTDIGDLKKRLAEKVETGKVIVMKGSGKTSFPWLRVAALVIVIAGAGLLAKQFIFNNPSKNIAQSETKKSEEPKANDTAASVAISSVPDTTKTNSGTVITPLKQNEKTSTFISTDSMAAGKFSNGTVGETSIPNSGLIVTKPDRDNKVPTTTVKTEEGKDVQYKIATGSDKKDVAFDEVKNKPGVINNQEISKEVVKDKSLQQDNDLQKNRRAAQSRKITEAQFYHDLTANTFKGRVTDANNVGLPFARVYNPADNNAGTYTDVAGNFNLTFPDSVLNVQVRSVGFENTNVQLRNNVANNQVILQDDKSLAAQTLPAPRKINAEERSKIAKVKLEEPEPADGWDNYDTYLTNNLNVPEEVKTKQNAAGEVQVSFEVDKNGEPINIKVEKSLCSKCDQEAIRLIKEGPKWKRNAKKGRTTVTVPFNNSL